MTDAADRTRHAVADILQRAAVPRDGILIVHSAIRGLSRQGHRAEPMIGAMLDHLGGGTLLMPTMTWRTVTPDQPVFDELATPSHTGVLTEVFRCRYASARSLHPTHSVAGKGPLAAELLSGHHLGGGTPVSATSPYGRLRGRDARILMIGVGLECATAIHHPEELVAPELYLRPAAEAEDYTLRDRHGATFPMRLRRHRRLPRDFPKFGAPLAARGLSTAGVLDGVPWLVVPFDALLDEVFAALARDPAGTLADGAVP